MHTSALRNYLLQPETRTAIDQNTFATSQSTDPTGRRTPIVCEDHCFGVDFSPVASTFDFHDKFLGENLGRERRAGTLIYRHFGFE